MAKSADDRPATGEVLADTIEGLLQYRRDPSAANTVTIPTTPTSSGPRISSKQLAQPVNRRRLWAGAAVATVLVATVAAIVAFPLGGALLGNNTGTDSLPPETTAVVNPLDSTTILGPATPVNSLPPGRTTGPGRGTTPAGRATTGIVVVNAPADARITIADQEIGFGQSRRDSLAPGTYAVRAELPAIPGCDESRQMTTVNVVAGRTHTVNLAPRLCGTIIVKASGRDGKNQPVPRELWYSMQPEGGVEPPDQPLAPGGLTKVMAVGKYTLRVKMRNCATYEDPLEIFAGEPISRQSITLLCP
jgi:hypothetical protein